MVGHRVPFTLIFIRHNRPAIALSPLTDKHLDAISEPADLP